MKKKSKFKGFGQLAASTMGTTFMAGAMEGVASGSSAPMTPLIKAHGTVASAMGTRMAINQISKIHKPRRNKRRR